MKGSDVFKNPPPDKHPNAESHDCSDDIDSELQKAIQFEMWELGSTQHGDNSTPPEGIDSDVIRASALLSRVFNKPAPPETTEYPRKIGRFRIVTMLGAGRFGVVWRAFDPSSGREIALKVIHQSQLFDVNHRRRFLRECSMAAKLDHPAIVPMYETGTADGMPYLVMPVCEGQTLDKWFAARSETISSQVAAEIAMQIASAADYGHQQGVLHRDLKPGNVMISRLARSDQDSGLMVRIMDFGLAIPVEVSLRDTRGSLIAGTPVYMAPEQAECRTDEIGIASDIFAIGAVLYELLTGDPPFNAPTLPAVIERLQSESAASIRAIRADVSVDLEAICLKCLAHEPRNRYSSARELADDLRRYLAEHPVSARPISRMSRMLAWCALRRGRQHLAQTAVVINFVIMLWSIASLPAAFAEIPAGTVSWNTTLPILVPLFAFIVPLHLLLIRLSLQIRREYNSSRNGMIAFAISVTTLVYALSVLFDLAPAAPSPAYARNPFARDVAFTLVITGFSILTVIYGLLTITRPRRS